MKGRERSERGERQTETRRCQERARAGRKTREQQGDGDEHGARRGDGDRSEVRNESAEAAGHESQLLELQTVARIRGSREEAKDRAARLERERGQRYFFSRRQDPERPFPPARLRSPRAFVRADRQVPGVARGRGRRSGARPPPVPATTARSCRAPSPRENPRRTLRSAGPKPNETDSAEAKARTKRPGTATPARAIQTSGRGASFI